ncbi:hypothetical protein CDAR_419261 [Caerostris darwini]|uniref:Uncharacterized protein n=1 Tax=Caerostris darwini TaxID=1538125 RepID=A0AAV4TPF6_9ARAC|nr:hypothetical protein CDAR_419261 [Caerostris darwini]
MELSMLRSTRIHDILDPPIRPYAAGIRNTIILQEANASHHTKSQPRSLISRRRNCSTKGTSRHSRYLNPIEYILEKTPGHLQAGSRNEGQGQDVDEDEEESVVALPHLIGQVDEAGQPGDLAVGTLQCVVEGSGRV